MCSDAKLIFVAGFIPPTRWLPNSKCSLCIFKVKISRGISRLKYLEVIKLIGVEKKSKNKQHENNGDQWINRLFYRCTSSCFLSLISAAIRFLRSKISISIKISVCNQNARLAQFFNFLNRPSNLTIAIFVSLTQMYELPFRCCPAYKPVRIATNIVVAADS